MNLARLPRRRYVTSPTPIERLEHFSRALGGPDVYMKRDDLLPGPAGGNKTRKLEFSMAEALERGADSIVTCGAIQSNHCRLTLGWAVKEGLACHMVLEEVVPGTYNPEASGNNFLYQLMGVDSIKVVPKGADMEAELRAAAAACEAEGKKPYVIPSGASNAVGATGYVACAEELMGQLNELGLAIDHIVTPSGSAGTHAGLVVGLGGLNANIPVSGMSVIQNKAAIEAKVFDLAVATAERVGCPPPPREAVVCFDEYIGPGYSLPTPEMVEAVTLLARTEGILLDPVYSGKTMAGLIDQIRQGRFVHGQKVLFLHTGGTPALYAYMGAFRSEWERLERGA